MSLIKIIGVTLLLLSFSAAGASVSYSDHFRYVEPGWRKLMASDIDGCLELWDQQSIAILSQSRSDDAFLAAGFLQALVTMLYQKNKDANAYQSWLTAQSYFSYSKTPWKTYTLGMQNYFLSAFLNEKDRQLEETIQVRTKPAAKLNDADLSLFIAMETAFNLSQFRGPKSGLSTAKAPKTGVPTRGLVGRSQLAGILPYENHQKYSSEIDSASLAQRSLPSNTSMIGGSNRGGVEGSLTKVSAPADGAGVVLTPATVSSSTAAPQANAADGNSANINSVMAPPSDWFLEAMDETVNGVNPWLLPSSVFVVTEGSGTDTLSAVPMADNALVGKGSTLAHIEPLAVNPDGSIRPVLSIPDSLDKELPLNAEGTSLNQPAAQGDLPSEETTVPAVMAFRGQTGVKAQEQLPTLVSAKRAWQYFDRNLQPTGMVNASDQYDYTDLWSMGSSLAAIIAAFKLQVINQETFDDIVERFLTTLLEMPLYRGILPNNLYHTRDATMVTPSNEPTEVGSDWNAVGLGRLLIWLKILVNWYPAYNDTVGGIINRFDLSQAFNDKGLHRAEYVAGVEKTAIDTTLGYAHYAQFGFAVWGRLGSIPDISTYPETELYTIPIRYDDNENAHLVSDPFFLAQMEIDSLDEAFLLQSLRIYQVQKAHSFTQKKPIVFTELNLDKPPWFIYLNIFHQETAWQALDFSGKPYPEHLAYSTHGLFMMDAIFNDNYSQQWIEKASGFGYLDYGFPSGRRDNGIPIHSYTANTNGIILQSLLYQHVTKMAFSASK